MDDLTIYSIFFSEVPDNRICPAPRMRSVAQHLCGNDQCSTNNDCPPGTRCCSTTCCQGSCKKECVKPVFPGTNNYHLNSQHHNRHVSDIKLVVSTMDNQEIHLSCSCIWGTLWSMEVSTCQFNTCLRENFQEGESVGGVGAGWKWLKILPEMVWISWC